VRLLYLFFPRYPVQRRVLEQPSLAGRPVLLHADERGSQRVRFASGAALKRGVRPGMTVASAMALEPGVVRLPFEPAVEAKALASLGEMLLPLSPGFQVDAPEGLWLDASAAHLCGGEAPWAERVLGACRHLGLRGVGVVGSERFSTRALARWGRESLLVVPERGGPALARLPLLALEEGWLGPGAAAPFRALGLSTLGELAGLPPGALVGRFGAMGHQAARLCRGEDDSAFVPDALPEVLEETAQLDWPAEQLEPVLFALKMLVDRLCARLQGRQQAAVRLTVTVALEGGEPVPVPLVLARPSAQARLLLELIRHRLTDLTVRHPIAALHVRVEETSRDPGRQLALGDAPVGEAELEVVLSRLQSALGEEALFSAAPAATHRPEAAWARARFAPPAAESAWVGFSVAPPGEAEIWARHRAKLDAREAVDVPVEVEAAAKLESPEAPSPAASPPRAPLKDPWAGLPPRPARWPKRKAKVEQAPPVLAATQATRPPRLFREPARLASELAGDGRLVSVVVAGRRRRVESLAGPERLVGAWWCPEPFARDYYRLQVEGVGQLWVFRDGGDGAFYAQGVFD
jgi:protein ImuB